MSSSSARMSALRSHDGGPPARTLTAWSASPGRTSVSPCWRRLGAGARALTPRGGSSTARPATTSTALWARSDSACVASPSRSSHVRDRASAGSIPSPACSTTTITGSDAVAAARAKAATSPRTRDRTDADSGPRAAPSSPSRSPSARCIAPAIHVPRPSTSTQRPGVSSDSRSSRATIVSHSGGRRATCAAIRSPIDPSRGSAVAT
jgi:hypothetical protein